MTDANTIKQMRLALLEYVKHDDDRVVVFGTTDSYCEFYFLAPDDKDLDKLDVAGCIEETLHRMLDEGFDDDMVYAVLGAVNSDPDEYDNDVLYIDLGYWIGGQILRGIRYVDDVR